MSSSGSSLADWLRRLETFSPYEIEMGLERVHDVLERLQPVLPGRIFHIAGTNGKGSSVAFAAALLGTTGERIGTYTSPHICRFNERICIDGAEASDAEIVAAFVRVDAARGDTPLTYFEFGTIAAMLVFEVRKVDIAILEVGMGGRLDAVNAFEPTASLITNVSLDHCAWLGNDVASIAREKAGVMRAGKPCVFADSFYSDPISDPISISGCATELGADLRMVGRDYSWVRDSGREGWSWQGRTHTLVGLKTPSLAGEFQLGNAAGVLALLEAAGFDDLLRVDIVNNAFAKPALAGRMQRIDARPQWLLDVAHNAAAATVLAETLAEDEIGGETIAIVGLLDDKDVAAVIAPLLPHVNHWIAITAASHRALAAEELARQIANLGDAPCLIAGSLQRAMDQAQEWASPEDRILVCGSFYVVGPVLAALGLYSHGKGES